MTQPSDDAATRPHGGERPGPAPQGYGAPPGYGPPPGYPPAYGPPPGYRLPAPPAVGPAGQPLAGFGDRLLAYLIDGAILLVAMMIVAVPIFLLLLAGWTSDFAEMTDPYGAEPDPSVFFREFLLPLLLFEAGFLFFALAVYYVYHVEMMYRSGQTVGKRVMKLRVVPLDPAATLTRGAAAKRYGVEFVAATFVPVLSYLNGLWQLWDKPYQQCLHDKAAGTIVIKVPS